MIGPISLRIAAGECVSLGGPSGAGKSLLLRAIADLDEHRGDALLEGVSYRRVPPTTWRRKVGLLPPKSHWWHERASDHGLPDEPSWLRDLGLDRDLAEQPIDRLSDGEQQRFALLRLLGNRPRALLLDEPTANLDPENVRRLEVLVQRYCRERPACALWITHDPAQATRVGARRLRLERGGLVPVPRPSP